MRTVFITGAARGIGAATAERFGVIEVAIANAGIHTTGSLLTMPPEQIERVIEVNLFGVLRTLGVAGQVVS